MRILHTSDWHLGKYLEDYSRLEEQEKFIDELVEIVEAQNIDMVIIAGDIYDNSNPPAKAERLFYNAVKRLSGGGKRIILIIAGNHDNPDRLVSSKPLAYEHGIILLGTPKSTVEAGSIGDHRLVDTGEGYLEIEINNEKAIVLTLPYPSEQRLNEVFSGVKDEEEMQRSYSQRVGQIFEDLSKKFRDDTINVAVSHLFVMGGETTDSERPIQIGGGLTVEASNLPPKAHYIALGHLHKPQRVRGASLNAYYSGSPIQYSRSEMGHEKCVFVVDAKTNEEVKIEKIPLKVMKPIEVWKCNGVSEALETCMANKDRDVWAYLEIKTDKIISPSEIKEIKTIKPDILNIIPLIDDREIEEEEQEDFREKNMMELFKEFYLEERMVEPSQELMAIFSEIAAEEGDENEATNS